MSQGTPKRAYAFLPAVPASQVAPRDGFREDPIDGDADTLTSELSPS